MCSRLVLIWKKSTVKKLTYISQSKKRDNHHGLVTGLYFKKEMPIRAISPKHHFRGLQSRNGFVYFQKNIQDK